MQTPPLKPIPGGGFQGNPTDRNFKAARLLARPGCTSKPSPKYSSQRAVKSLSAPSSRVIAAQTPNAQNQLSEYRLTGCAKVVGLKAARPDVLILAIPKYESSLSGLVSPTESETTGTVSSNPDLKHRAREPSLLPPGLSVNVRMSFDIIGLVSTSEP
jgi:hypothetical protein